jgi:hypothetical protein
MKVLGTLQEYQTQIKEAASTPKIMLQPPPDNFAAALGRH